MYEKPKIFLCRIAIGINKLWKLRSSREKCTKHKKNQIGMMINDVKRIMGEPEMIEIYPYNPKEYVFRYLSPSGYEDQFHIYISRSDSTVIRIDDGF